MQVGECWKRIEHPTCEDLESSDEDPRLEKFFRLGSIVKIKGISRLGKKRKILIDVECEGDVLMIAEEIFRSFWKKELPAPPPAVIPLPRVRKDEIINIRQLRIGDTLDNIPLVECPVCGDTAFTLGQMYDHNWMPSGEESFAHKVANLTRSRGDVIESCELSHKKSKKKRKGH